MAIVDLTQFVTEDTGKARRQRLLESVDTALSRLAPDAGAGDLFGASLGASIGQAVLNEVQGPTETDRLVEFRNQLLSKVDASNPEKLKQASMIAKETGDTKLAFALAERANQLEVVATKSEREGEKFLKQQEKMDADIAGIKSRMENSRAQLGIAREYLALAKRKQAGGGGGGAEAVRVKDYPAAIQKTLLKYGGLTGDDVPTEDQLSVAFAKQDEELDRKAKEKLADKLVGQVKPPQVLQTKEILQQAAGGEPGFWDRIGLGNKKEVDTKGIGGEITKEAIRLSTTEEIPYQKAVLWAAYRNGLEQFKDGYDTVQAALDVKKKLREQPEKAPEGKPTVDRATLEQTFQQIRKENPDWSKAQVAAEMKKRLNL